jgi:hypothetical protein
LLPDNLELLSLNPDLLIQKGRHMIGSGTRRRIDSRENVNKNQIQDMP